MLPRGIRLNNPGNIRKSLISWQGESTLQDDPDFLRFETPEAGLRALMKILINYQELDGLEYIQAMIGRWAPPSENDTNAYAINVAKHVGVKPLDYLSVLIPENLIRMAQAIVRQENGACPDPTLPWWFADEVYESAAQLALGHTIQPIV